MAYSCTGICTTKQSGCPLIVNVHMFAVQCSSFLFKANCIAISHQVYKSCINWLCISARAEHATLKDWVPFPLHVAFDSLTRGKQLMAKLAHHITMKGISSVGVKRL